MISNFHVAHLPCCLSFPWIFCRAEQYSLSTGVSSTTLGAVLSAVSEISR